MAAIRDTDDPLLAVLRAPRHMATLGEVQWSAVLHRARPIGLLSRLAVLADDAGVVDALPAAVRRHLRWGRIEGVENARLFGWEVNRVRRALAPLDVPIVLLKGVAYQQAGLDAGRGRISTDLDVMVPFDRLDACEAALKAGGWQSVKSNDYDDRYYRRWMHELPPLRHADRHTVVDLHHTILPRTARLKPDAAALIAEAVPLDGGPTRVLAPADMVLHSAVHLVEDSDFGGRLRDLVDIDALVREFATRDGFWDTLVARARLHGLTGPLWHTLTLAQRLLGTDLSDAVATRLSPLKPAAPGRLCLQGLGARSLLSGGYGRQYTTRAGRLAQWLLYLRSHWRRMPPALLAWHLAVKAWFRVTGRA